MTMVVEMIFFFLQAEDGIRDYKVTGVQTCALPICQLDVLTGDYLAELTMLILGRQRLQHPERGYAVTFLRQMEDCLGIALERGVTIVVNAGGLNPAGLASALRELAERLGLHAAIRSEERRV